MHLQGQKAWQFFSDVLEFPAIFLPNCMGNSLPTLSSPITITWNRQYFALVLYYSLLGSSQMKTSKYQTFQNQSLEND